MTISTRVREIVADLSGAMIETVSAETSIEGLFGADWTEDGIWPHMGTRLAIYADSPEDGRTAANWILAKWREWVNRDQTSMAL